MIDFYCDFIKTMNRSLEMRSRLKIAALLLITNDIRVNYTTIVLVFFSPFNFILQDIPYFTINTAIFHVISS